MKILTLALIAATALSGCSKLSSSATTEESGSPVQVLQDKMAALVLDTSGTNTGSAVYTYQSSALPAWALFNVNSSVLSGIPTSYQDAFNIQITRFANGGSPTYLGRYRVNVYGNPLKDQQWHLKNSGQKSYAYFAGTAGADIHMGTVIADGIDGTGVKIAISDTGVVLAHEGLQANVLAGQSRNYYNDFGTTATWIGDPTPTTADSENAHGTAVASLAAQAGWNGLGGRGVAPLAKLAGFLFLPAQDQLAATGYLTAALNDQFTGTFDIFNYSWGDSQCEFTQHSPSTLAKLQSGAGTQRGGLGSIFVAAAGNSYYDSLGSCVLGSKTGYYGSAESSDVATTPYSVIVGATNADGVASSYSSPGANIWIGAPGGEFGFAHNYTGGNVKYGKPAMIAADFPGCDVGLKTLAQGLSLFDAGTAPNGSCKYVSTMNGTSSASPVAAGAIALILQANPALYWRDVKYILAATADKIDPAVNPVHHPDTNYDLAGHTYEQGWVTNAAGFHFMNYYGFGRINVAAAVAMAKTFSVNLGSLSISNYADDSGVISVAIPDASATGVTQTLTTAQALTLEAVQLKISISGCIGDIGIELTSPLGTKSILYNTNSLLANAALTDQVFLSNAFYGEASVGTWSMKLIDAHAGCSASLTRWALNFYGH